MAVAHCLSLAGHFQDVRAQPKFPALHVLLEASANKQMLGELHGLHEYVTCRSVCQVDNHCQSNGALLACCAALRPYGASKGHASPASGRSLQAEAA